MATSTKKRPMATGKKSSSKKK